MTYDAVIVGAGPGGATAAACMAQDGLRVLLLDKARFPRDKICGDAISGKSVDVLRRLGVIDCLEQIGSQGSWGITFGAPSGDTVAIPFTQEYDRPVPPTFVCPRKTFDQILADRAVAAGATLHEEATVEDLLWDDDRGRGRASQAGLPLPFDQRAACDRGRRGLLGGSPAFRDDPASARPLRGGAPGLL